MMRQQLRRLAIPARRFEARTGDEAAEWVVAREWDPALNAHFDTRPQQTGPLALTPGERYLRRMRVGIWIGIRTSIRARKGVKYKRSSTRVRRGWPARSHPRRAWLRQSKRLSPHPEDNEMYH